MELGEPPGRDDGDCLVRGAGLVARTTLEPREAIEGLDAIITTVPEGAQVLEFLDTAWVTPGAFVGAVDLARSWKRGTLRAMDILATDEREQTRVLTASGRMTFAGPTKRISPIWRAAPSRGAVRRRNARCSISPVTRWPIWLWHRSSTRQRCGKAWLRGWRAELTVCFGFGRFSAIVSERKRLRAGHFQFSLSAVFQLIILWSKVRVLPDSLQIK